MIKKLLLWVTCIGLPLPLPADFWTDLTAPDAEKIREFIERDNRVILYCPGCGDNGIFELYRLQEPAIVTSSWAKGKMEIKVKGVVLFKAEPVLNKDVMELNNTKCVNSKTTVEIADLSRNYHFHPADTEDTWISFAKKLGHEQLPESPSFLLSKSAKDKIAACN